MQGFRLIRLGFLTFLVSAPSHAQETVIWNYPGGARIMEMAKAPPSALHPITLVYPLDRGAITVQCGFSEGMSDVSTLVALRSPDLPSFKRPVIAHLQVLTRSGKRLAEISSPTIDTDVKPVSDKQDQAEPASNAHRHKRHHDDPRPAQQAPASLDVFIALGRDATFSLLRTLSAVPLGQTVLLHEGPEHSGSSAIFFPVGSQVSASEDGQQRQASEPMQAMISGCGGS